MRIYCLTCREYIMNSSPEFVLGGPYHGAMFEGATGDYWSATMFRQVESVKGGDLFCPRCTGRFFSDTGGLLTEHGVVQAGQKSVDTTFNIVHQDGPAKGQLMYIRDSIIPIEDWDAFKSQPSSIIIDKETGKEVQAHTDKDVSGPVVTELDWKTAVKKGPEDDLKCKSCGRQYRDPDWRDKHQRKCKG